MLLDDYVEFLISLHIGTLVTIYPCNIWSFCFDHFKNYLSELICTGGNVLFYLSLTFIYVCATFSISHLIVVLC